MICVVWGFDEMSIFTDSEMWSFVGCGCSILYQNTCVFDCFFLFLEKLTHLFFFCFAHKRRWGITLWFKSYVYGTVHHLYSWVKRKPTWCHLFYYFIRCSFNAQHVSAVNTTIFRSLRLTGCYLVWCVLAFSVLIKHFSASDCIKTPHRHSHTETERQHTPNQITTS